jgi:hypothetical protein
MTIAQEFEAMGNAASVFRDITAHLERFFLRAGNNQSFWNYPIEIVFDDPLQLKLNLLTSDEQDYLDNILEAVGEKRGKSLVLHFRGNSDWYLEITPIFPDNNLDDGDDDTSPKPSFEKPALVMAAGAR